MRFTYYILTLSIILGACQEVPEDDIQVWINTNQNIAVSRAISILEQENFQEFKYQTKDRIDPFDPKKISPVFTGDPAAGNVFSPDINRTK